MLRHTQKPVSVVTEEPLKLPGRTSSLPMIGARPAARHHPKHEALARPVESRSDSPGLARKAA
jgi:hypothetical protein